MTRREMQALARIVADHEYAAAAAAANVGNTGAEFPRELTGAIATDDRILAEVLGLDVQAARRWKDRAMAWAIDPEIFKI